MTSVLHPRRYDRPITVFVDQDGPLADFESQARRLGLEPKDAKMLAGFYRGLPCTPGARRAIAEIATWPQVQLFVATKIPDRNPLAASEKIFWLHEHFPEFGERIIVTPNKACLGGPRDVLIDDRAHKADAGHFGGTFIHFLSPAYPDWDAVLDTLRELVKA